MKKYIIFFFIFAGLMTIVSQNTKADSYNPGFGQEQPCDQYWWPDLEWQGPIYKVVEIDGCFYLCAYFTRETPPGRHEFQMTEAVRLYGNCTTDHDFDLIKRTLYLDLFQGVADEVDPPYYSTFACVVQEALCRRAVPYEPNPYGDEIDPFSVDTLFITFNQSKLTTEDSLTIASVVDPPINGIYTLLIDRLWRFCPGTVCCRAFYSIFIEDLDHIIDKVLYDSLSQMTLQGPDTCSGQYCYYNCNSLIWNWSDDTLGGYFKSAINYEFDNSPKLKIFPTPVDKILEIEFDDEELGGLAIRIYDMNGIRIINEYQAKNTKLFKYKLDLSNIVKGVYFLEIKLNNKIYNKKFQIE